jgi:hypothetical protein
MSNLALTLSALKRFEEALVLQEKALQFSRRVLPANHPRMGESREGLSPRWFVL